MRYIGGKSLLLKEIYSQIQDKKDIHSVMDLFSGSGVVGSFFASKGYNVISNDFLYFSYVLSRGTTGLKNKPTFINLGISDVFSYLNNLKLSDTNYSLEDCFIYENYSPHENCKRMYFQNENAIKIDIIRMQIEDWKKSSQINEDEYYYLLAALIKAIPYVSNITGTYGAYLKYWDKRTYNPLTLIKPEIDGQIYRAQCFNGDYLELLSQKVDLIYADPPYNAREYLPNYHILETVAKYDNPKVKGVTGLREYKKQKSTFCKKGTVEKAFTDLLERANSKYILISYNNEGLMNLERLRELCKRYALAGSFHATEINYRRYKNKIPNNNEGLKEQLYFLEKQ